MIIELESLTERRNSISWDIPPDEIDLSDENARLDSASVSVIVEAGLESVLIKGTVRTEIGEGCVRCLEPFRHEQLIEFTAEFVSEDKFPSEKELELRGEELTVDIFDGVSIDLTSVVREQIVLDLPSYPVCAPECRGLCPICGVNRNIDDCSCADESVDPRWEVLKEIAGEK